MKQSIVLVFLCVAIVYGAPRPGFTLRGSIAGVEGKPMARADAMVFRYNENIPIASVMADSDGHFQLRIDGRGAYRVILSGAGHRAIETPIIVERSMKITVRATLETYAYAMNFDSVKIAGDFNSFAKSTARPMRKHSDGTFSADVFVKSDSLSYQLVGVARDGRTINGTMQDAYAPDGEGDYRSVVRADNGNVIVVFDPSKLFQSSEASSVTWRPNAIARSVTAYQHVDSMKNRYRESVSAEHGSDAAMARETALALHELDSLIHGETNDGARQMLYLGYIEFGLPGVMTGHPTVDTALIHRALDEIPPAAAVWEINPGLIVLAGALLNQSSIATEYINDVLANHPSDDVKEQVLFNAIQYAHFKDRIAESIVYYDKLVNEFADTKWARMAKEQFAPERRIMAGKQAPEFTVRSIDDSTAIITKELLNGKYVLIDFWAVWCGPCVAEMENLHAVYAKFKDRRFTILSVSFDKSPRDVVSFRARTWPMPWLHAFANGAFGSALAGAFEVHGIPKPVLVGPDGTILATDIELRGKNLGRTIEKYLQ